MNGLFTRRSLIGATGALARSGFAQEQNSKKLTIALSNSYIGDKWCIEMENVFKPAL